MKISGVVLLHLLMMAAQAQPPTEGFDGQAWQAPYVLPKPKGWGVERFPIPIAFAPEIPYKGVEDIRFAPGWAQAHSAAYWSYAFLWYLEGNVQLDTAKLRHHLAAYYTGLIAANGGHIPSDQLIPVAVSAIRTQRVGEDIDTYRGRVTMLDYMGKRPITLHYKAHIRQCPGKNHTFIFFELSPRPYTDGIWQKLGRLWRQFGCGN